MASICQGKGSWPELLGWCGEKAAAAILNENQPGILEVIVRGPNDVAPLRPGFFVCYRVVVRVDDKGIVNLVPVVGKLSWPELVGWCGVKAATIIENEKPDIYVIIASPVTPINPILTCDRVVVVVDEKGIVNSVPVVG